MDKTSTLAKGKRAKTTNQEPVNPAFPHQFIDWTSPAVITHTDKDVENVRIALSRAAEHAKQYPEPDFF